MKNYLLTVEHNHSSVIHRTTLQAVLTKQTDKKLPTIPLHNISIDEVDISFKSNIPDLKIIDAEIKVTKLLDCKNWDNFIFTPCFELTFNDGSIITIFTEHIGEHNKTYPESDSNFLILLIPETVVKTDFFDKKNREINFNTKDLIYKGFNSDLDGEPDYRHEII